MLVDSKSTPPCSALASLGLAASLWVAAPLARRLRPVWIWPQKTNRGHFSMMASVSSDEPKCSESVCSERRDVARQHHDVRALGVKPLKVAVQIRCSHYAHELFSLGNESYLKSFQDVLQSSMWHLLFMCGIRSARVFQAGPASAYR